MLALRAPRWQVSQAKDRAVVPPPARDASARPQGLSGAEGRPHVARMHRVAGERAAAAGTAAWSSGTVRPARMAQRRRPDALAGAR
jgi:hypothetical protein